MLSVAAGWQATDVSGQEAAAVAPIADFTLPEAAGGERRFAEFAGGRPAVVAFLGVRCPLSQRYAGRLAALAAEYEARGVAFVAIDPNGAETFQDMTAFARRFGLRMPFLKDNAATVADQFGATRVPEVFLIDRQRVVVYRGRIDDQHELTAKGLNVNRPAPQREDLRQAIEDLLAGRPIAVARTEASGCLIGRPLAVVEHPTVTWAEDVAPVLAAHCQSCHRDGEIAPMPLVTYEQAASWAAMIGEVVAQERMPPWHASPAYGHFKNENRLTAEERQLIATWVAEGAPPGDLASAPPPAPAEGSDDGWDIPTPDQVIAMAARPFPIPAQGVLEYEYFVVDPGWKEDKWIAAAECKPGSRETVHHINVFIVPPELRENWTRENLTYHLLQGYAPGFRASALPEGLAFFAKAGSWLVFQNHYTPSGAATEDLSLLGLVFADPSAVQRQVDFLLVQDDTFTIPPGAADFEVTAQWEFDEDVLVHALIPHLHLRGKSFRYEVYYPDSRGEILLEVPRYDFNWQNLYELVEPKPLPAGTIARVTAVYDNSDENPANPDPTQAVRWGDQTTDEMMIGYMLISRPKGAAPLAQRFLTPPPPQGDSPARLAAVGAVLVLAGLFVAALVALRRRGGAPREAATR